MNAPHWSDRVVGTVVAPVPSATSATSANEGNAPMNAPTSALAPVVALSSLRSVPSSLHVDPSLPGLAGVLVLFRAPSTRPTPAAMRTTWEDALDRSMAPVAAALAPGMHAAHIDAGHGGAFLGSLPDVVSPVAALGLAVRAARDDGSEWVHNRTVEKASRWTYCASTVTADAVSIHGHGTSAEAFPDGRLVVDAGVPSHIADKLRAAYDAARGVVEPSKVKTIVARYLERRGGRAITDDCYLLPETTPATCGVLAGLVDLGGWAETVAVADPQRIARLSSPVTKSIEQQIADVVEATQAFIAKASAVASGATIEVTSPTGIKRQQLVRMSDTGGEHARAQIAAAREAAALWRDRLSLASLDVDAQLDALDDAAAKADAEALAAMEARRAAKRPAPKNAPSTAATV